jgi:hypothetical protein
MEMAKPTMYLKEEWHVRNKVMDAILDLLSDGQEQTSRQILDRLEKRGFTIPKRLVNSVLFSEARRYVFYDKKTFTYRLREAESSEIDQTLSFVSVSTNGRNENGSYEIKAQYIGRNDEYIFTTSKLTGPAFFEISAKSRTIEIILNENHPLFPSFDLLVDPISQGDCQDMYQSLIQARKTLELLLAAWSKYESDQPDGPRKFKAQEARLDWGRNARAFLMDDLEDDE